MSIVHMRQISAQMKKLFHDSIDCSDIRGDNNDAEKSFLSRALAGYSILDMCSAKPEDIAPFIVDGFNDNGIDAIYYSKTERELYVVQSKWISDGKNNVPQADVLKFTNGIRDLLNFQFERFNDKLNKHKDIIQNAINDSETRFHIVLAHTGTEKISTHARRVIDDLLTEMNDPTEVLSFAEINQERIHHSIVMGASGSPIKYSISLHDWGVVRDPSIAYYGQANASDIGKLWLDHRNRLFDGNLRSILGSTDVNSEITETISANPELFWYFNNGVTMIANKVTKTVAGGSDRKSGTFDCIGISIVNGAQTVGCIGKYYENSPNAIGNVMVPMRIISLESSPADFGSRIARTNNRQNKIENRDFVTLDPEQGRIKSELQIDGITYHIMRSAETAKGANSFDIVESTTALAVVSNDIKLVVQRKREISKMWDNLNKPPYTSLFNKNVTGRYVWQSVQLNRRIESVISKLEKEKAGRLKAVLIHGNYIIAFMLASEYGSAKIKDIDFVNTAITEEWINDRVNAYANALQEQIDATYGKNSVIPTLFKNPTKCKALYGSIKK
ncbi:MAG: AIPR family protein [Nitrospinota bacterium]|nr:AIPR family protein [Nitrospinota bacterium]